MSAIIKNSRHIYIIKKTTENAGNDLINEKCEEEQNDGNDRELQKQYNYVEHNRK